MLLLLGLAAAFGAAGIVLLFVVIAGYELIRAGKRAERKRVGATPSPQTPASERQQRDAPHGPAA